MNMQTSNSFEHEEPTREILGGLPLAREIIGDVTIELDRVRGDDVVISVTHGRETLKTLRFKGITDFQAGRIFEREVVAYNGIIK